MYAGLHQGIRFASKGLLHATVSRKQMNPDAGFVNWYWVYIQ
ncbi:hypothetical protein [Photobacterium sp. 53610]